MKYHFKTGDQVVVISGSDKGHVSEILSVIRKANRVVVKGAAMVTSHEKPSQKYPKGGRIRKESSLHISNIAHCEPGGRSPVRVGVRKEKEGVKVLFSRKTGKKVRDVV